MVCAAAPAPFTVLSERIDSVVDEDVVLMKASEGDLVWGAKGRRGQRRRHRSWLHAGRTPLVVFAALVVVVCRWTWRGLSRPCSSLPSSC